MYSTQGRLPITYRSYHILTHHNMYKNYHALLPTLVRYITIFLDIRCVFSVDDCQRQKLSICFLSTNMLETQEDLQIGPYFLMNYLKSNKIRRMAKSLIKICRNFIVVKFDKGNKYNDVPLNISLVA